MKRSILLVDDDRALVEVLAERLPEFGFEARAESDPRRAMAALSEGDWAALVTDLRMPEVDGLSLLAHSKRLAPDRPVLVMTAFSAVDTAIESIRRGAFHYLTKPFKLDELALFLERALETSALIDRNRSLESELRGRVALGSLVASSPSMTRVLELLARVARTSLPVLITGETGSGKGVAARALHEESRRAGRFVTINCAALPEALLESELFGHTRGAFSGAVSSRTGLISEADGGTLFLDEIGDMGLHLQAKLLDVLERGVVRPLGSNREVSVDLRVVAATHHDLNDAVAAGRFREDLFFRLAAVEAAIPPLRQRRQDLPALIALFLERARRESPGAQGRRFSEAALKRLIEAAWPGNVRELEHVIRRSVVLAPRDEIDEALLPSSLVPSSDPRAGFFLGEEVLPMRAVQRRYAEWALRQMGGQRKLTHERLEIDPKTLRKLLDDE